MSLRASGVFFLADEGPLLAKARFASPSRISPIHAPWNSCCGLEYSTAGRSGPDYLPKDFQGLPSDNHSSGGVLLWISEQPQHLGILSTAVTDDRQLQSPGHTLVKLSAEKAFHFLFSLQTSQLGNPQICSAPQILQPGSGLPMLSNTVVLNLPNAAILYYSSSWFGDAQT